MSGTTPAVWFFDVISPYSYLHFKQFSRLAPGLAIEYAPVLFAGLLKAWGTKGPAELPGKRLHTYRQCVWIARAHDIPFRMPPRHPFNPLRPLRLLVGLGAPRSAIASVFDFIWAEGRDPEHEWPALCERVGVLDTEAIVADPLVKQGLLANTERAIAAGAWGVPTFLVGGELFWGADTIDWMNAFRDEPAMFADGEMKRVAGIEFGVARS